MGPLLLKWFAVSALATMPGTVAAANSMKVVDIL
jgi:hypothetical protein